MEQTARGLVPLQESFGRLDDAFFLMRGASCIKISRTGFFMRFGHAVAALLLTLLLVANAEEAMEFSPVFPIPHRPEIIPCFPSKDCSTVRCRGILPEDCPSGRTIRCGCCDVCLVELECGEQCRFFVPNNARCGPGLRCGSYGQCEYKPGFHPGVPAPGL
ncbi:Protein of unknown function [Gryllus bimaculatus]|nr:Protein of unknown function [Gryllus bimaculatus]